MYRCNDQKCWPRWVGACVLVVLSSCSENKQKAGIVGQSNSTASEESYEEEEVEEEEIEDLATVIKQCGVSEKDLEKPDTVLMEKTIKGYPKVFTGSEAVPLLGNINYKVSVTTVVNIRATMSEIEQNTDFEITGQPKQAESKAWERAEPNQGSTIMRLYNLEERTELMGKEEDWARIFCTVMPVREVHTTKGGMSRSVTFSPALPGNLSPRADPKRYVKEIGDQKIFSGIKAKIIDSDDDKYPEGKTLTGTATITKIDPVLKVMAGGKVKDTIRADIAYRISYDFGSRENTVALGLMPAQTMYISYDDKDLKVIVADTGFEDGGTVVLSDSL